MLVLFQSVDLKWLFLKIIYDLLIPLGKMMINSILDFTKVSSVLVEDFNEPSLFDLKVEDIQDCDIAK